MGKRDNYIYPAQTDSDFFGLTSDWHIGNRFTNEGYILDYLDLLKERGVKQIFHGGDLFEGYRIYPAQLNELHPDCYGIKEQINYFNELIPEQRDLNMKLISGNHLIKNNKGKNVVQELCDQRVDIDYLGKYTGYVGLKDGLTMNLIHPSRKSLYGKLYKTNKYLNTFQNKPDIFGIGHKHKSDCKLYGSTQVYHLGTFLDKKPNANQYPPDIGAWIIELDIDNGEIISNNSEWIGY
ncbi:MAG: hypothetical protein DRP06_00655 [Candidatus Aenigmatarchaeota archaeon]|nr:MAG: hypothetical protein DRP06_00655 [Candidatus Aenigmarchaeota archaeon]